MRSDLLQWRGYGDVQPIQSQGRRSRDCYVGFGSCEKLQERVPVEVCREFKLLPTNASRFQRHSRGERTTLIHSSFLRQTSKSTITHLKRKFRLVRLAGFGITFAARDSLDLYVSFWWTRLGLDSHHCLFHGKDGPLRGPRGRRKVILDMRRIAGETDDSDWHTETLQDFLGRCFYTCYMGTSNSSGETRGRAKQLAKDIGAVHRDLNMNTVITALVTLFTMVTNFTPKFKVHGGSNTENLALQNIQARSRMVVSYLFA